MLLLNSSNLWANLSFVKTAALIPLQTWSFQNLHIWFYTVKTHNLIYIVPYSLFICFLDYWSYIFLWFLSATALNLQQQIVWYRRAAWNMQFTDLQTSNVGKTVSDWVWKEFPDYHFVSPAQITRSPEESMFSENWTLSY